ncbi:MAG TPA: prenyltransferase/squalene oxidase repeat-containing protein [Solirubrobacterales bacterium]
MSWEPAAFLILGAVLLGGFAWYERSRPPSQVVALVAALAALAIAGRIAFAAFPNVKPTTDIVIFAGYALGGAPGFAVGALAALVSNFWFGQGPWTPWQMAGWGLCGVFGAGLALGGRNAGRLSLAATCGFAGIAYGALLNFSLMATYGGELSLQRFGVLEARAIPFDAAHAIGNVALALVAGPAMVRMLIRFRERFEWNRSPAGSAAAGPDGGSRGKRPRRGWKPALRGGGVTALLAAVLLLGALLPAQANASAGGHAADWLEAQQRPNGGFAADADRDPGAEQTCWAMLGLAAAGRNPLDVTKEGRSPVDFLRGHVDELDRPGDVARTILALESAGVDPRDFVGDNLVAELLAMRRDNGSYEGWPNSTAYAVIALRSAGVSGGVEKTLSWLRKVQNDDGGWGDVPGSPSTADGTGAVLQALSPDSKASDKGVSYLRDVQRKGGGFSLGGNGAVNSQSTAWAVQGLIAAGANPSDFRRGGKSALDYLAEHQEGDGHYRYSGASDQTPVWVTAEVLVPVAGDYLPIAAPPRKPKPKDSSRTSSKNSGGLPPGIVSPGTASESSPVLPPASTSGGAGSLREGFAPQGPGRSKAPAGTSPPAGRESGGSGTSGPAPIASDPANASSSGSSADESTSTAGAIVLGLLAGCLLFACGLGARRGWMRWRYGL